MQLRKLSAQRFVEVPLIVIPNLFRDRLIFQRPEGPKNETIGPGQPLFLLSFSREQCELSDTLFLGFYSLQRSAGLGF